MSIKLSPKHGLNPSLMQCFYCGESYGVALLGMCKDDKEAPRQAVYDMEPCDKCKGYMQQGVILISVRDEDAGSATPFRTGNFAVVTEEAIQRIIQPAELRDSLLKKRVAFVPDAAWRMLGLPTGEQSATRETTAHDDDTATK